MTTVPEVFRQIFWYAPIPLQAIVLIVMWLRRQYRVLPYFFAYNAGIMLQVIVCLSLGKSSPFYMDAYWSGELISYALGLAIIYEIYASLLREYAVLRKIGIVLFWVTAGTLLLVAAWTAYNSPGADTERFVQGLLTLDRSVRIVQCGLLIALFIFASFFGLSWKHQLFGIALGFAIFACTELAVVAVRAYAGHTQFSSPFYRYLNAGSWDVALIVWMLYLIKQWRAPDLRALPKTELGAWNETLQELLRR